MAGPVTDVHRSVYRDNVIQAVQETKAKFEDAFMFDPSLKGEQAQVVDIVGATEARENAPEGGDTPNIVGTHEPVWCNPTRLDWGRLIEKGDAIRTLTDYTSSYVQGGAAAMVRKQNAVMARAIFGDRRIGKQGVTTSSYVATNRTVAKTVGDPSAGNTGMNVKKILRAIRYLEDFEIDADEEDLFCTVDSVEMEELYGDVTFTSKDYREKSVIDQDRRVRKIMNVNIIQSNRLSVYDAAEASNTSVASLHCKRGMYWGEFSPLDAWSRPNTAKQGREQCYMERYIGATRTQDELVVKILNHRA